MKRLRALSLLTLAAYFPAVVQAQTPRQVAQKIFPSVVLLVMEDANGQPIGLGSGFFVQGDVVATNLHVCDGASSGYARIVGRAKKYEVAGYVGIDAQRDLALLKIVGAKAPFIPLEHSDEVAIGDTVYTVGNPRGLEGTFSDGIISGIRRIRGDTLLQITAPISPGSSGGPVLNAEGKVIGVAVASFKGGQNLNFAIPSSYLESLLSESQAPSPLSTMQTGTSSKSSSILDALVRGGLEGVTGENFLWTYSSSFYNDFSFTIRNHLRESITDVYYLIIFYDSRGNPVDVYEHRSNLVIPSRLGKRVTGEAGEGVRKLTDTFEIRILDFRFAE